MTIEIKSAEVETLIQQRMQAGALKSPEDLIRAVLRSSGPVLFDARFLRVHKGVGYW